MDYEDEAPTKCWDIFDLQEDPNELHNAYNDPPYQKIINQMKEEIINQHKLLADGMKVSKKFWILLLNIGTINIE